MQAVESRNLREPAGPSRPVEELWQRVAGLATWLALALASWALIASLGPAVFAPAGRLVDRFTGADRIASAEVRVPRLADRPARPIPPEWRWSPPGVDVGAMFRQQHLGD